MTEVKEPQTVAEKIAADKALRKKYDFDRALESLAGVAEKTADRITAHQKAAETAAKKVEQYQTVFDKVVATTTEETTHEHAALVSEVMQAIQYDYTVDRLTLIDNYGPTKGNLYSDFLDLA